MINQNNIINEALDLIGDDDLNKLEEQQVEDITNNYIYCLNELLAYYDWSFATRYVRIDNPLLINYIPLPDSSSPYLSLGYKYTQLNVATGFQIKHNLNIYNYTCKEGDEIIYQYIGGDDVSAPFSVTGDYTINPTYLGLGETGIFTLDDAGSNSYTHILDISKIVKPDDTTILGTDSYIDDNSSSFFTMTLNGAGKTTVTTNLSSFIVEYDNRFQMTISRKTNKYGILETEELEKDMPATNIYPDFGEGYKYLYKIPDDCIRFKGIIETDDIKVAQNYIGAKDIGLTLVYITNDVARIISSPLFDRALALLLASKITMYLIADLQLKMSFYQEYQLIREKAITTDAYGKEQQKVKATRYQKIMHRHQ